MRPDIYKYEDFRQYLADLLEWHQSENPSLSQREIARQAEISNPGYLNDVIHARRNLSRNSLDKFCKVFKLSPKETEYLKLLVEFVQSKRQDEKEIAYQQILQRRARSSFARLNPALAKYYQDPRYPLIRAAIEACDFQGDFESLGAFLNPSLPAHFVRKAVEQLVEWQLLRIDGERYIVCDKMLEPAPTLNSQVRQLNRQWLESAAHAIERFPKGQRHISTVLMAISPETRQKINIKLEQFRREIFELIEGDSAPSEVFQMSLAFFPKSKVEE